MAEEDGERAACARGGCGRGRGTYHAAILPILQVHQLLVVCLDGVCYALKALGVRGFELWYGGSGGRTSLLGGISGALRGG